MDEINIENTLGALVLALADSMMRDVYAEAPETGGAAAAITLLRHVPGISIDRLRRALPLSHAGAVRLIDRLAADGLVVRRLSPEDKRAVALYLTNAGEQRCDAILAARNNRIAQALEELDETERRSLSLIVNKLLVRMVRCDDDAYSICRLCDAAACRSCPVDRALADKTEGTLG